MHTSFLETRVLILYNDNWWHRISALVYHKFRFHAIKLIALVIFPWQCHSEWSCADSESFDKVFIVVLVCWTLPVYECKLVPRQVALHGFMYFLNCSIEWISIKYFSFRFCILLKIYSTWTCLFRWALVVVRASRWCAVRVCAVRVCMWVCTYAASSACWVFVYSGFCCRW